MQAQQFAVHVVRARSISIAAVAIVKIRRSVVACEILESHVLRVRCESRTLGA